MAAVFLAKKKWMAAALSQARRSSRKGEVPVGAVLVKDDKIIARAHNLTRTRRDPTAHAEMVALQMAARKLKNERLTEVQLYVTLEPCAMCAGALIQARVSHIVFGARDLKAGACGSVLRVIPNKKLNHRPVVIKDMQARAAAKILKDFFRKRRK